MQSRLEHGLDLSESRALTFNCAAASETATCWIRSVSCCLGFPSPSSSHRESRPWNWAWMEGGAAVLYQRRSGAVLTLHVQEPEVEQNGSERKQLEWDFLVRLMRLPCHQDQWSDSSVGSSCIWFGFALEHFVQMKCYRKAQNVKPRKVDNEWTGQGCSPTEEAWHLHDLKRAGREARGQRTTLPADWWTWYGCWKVHGVRKSDPGLNFISALYGACVLGKEDSLSERMRLWSELEKEKNCNNRWK